MVGGMLQYVKGRKPTCISGANTVVEDAALPRAGSAVVVVVAAAAAAAGEYACETCLHNCQEERGSGGTGTKILMPDFSHNCQDRKSDEGEGKRDGDI